MKRKILITLGIITVFIFTINFLYLHLFKKSPIQPEQYIKTLAERGIQVEDESHKIHETLKNIVLESYHYKGKECITQYTVFNNNITAEQVLVQSYNNVSSAYSDKKEYNFSKYKLKIKHSNENYNKKLSNNNYSYYSTHIDDNYFLWVRVENTLLHFSTSKDNQKIVDEIVKILNYDPDGLMLMLTFQAIASILSAIIILYCLMQIFKKHNIEPIFTFIPIANMYYLCKIADKNGWKMLFFLIPFFNIIYYFILAYKLAKIYTDSKFICLGMGFMPYVFLPIIAFNEPLIRENKNVYEEILKEYEEN